ncbi:MAG: MFS transporter [Candidatus Kariarchaeaceae archaeon]|jgi:multidrug resistance protein
MTNSDISIQNQSNQKQMMVLFLSVFIDIVGFGLILPLLPLLATDMGATALLFGLLVASFSLMQFIFAPLWGKLSDRVGRRPVILIGIGGASLSFVVFGLSGNLWMLFLARSVSGIFTAATLTTSRAYIADITPPDKRAGAFGMLGAATGMGFVFGPVIGGILSSVSFLGSKGILLPGLFAASLSVINFMSAIVFLPETLESQQQKKAKQTERISNILNRKNLKKILVTHAFINFGFGTFIAVAGLYAITVNSSIDETTLGIMYSYTGILMMIVQGGIVKKISGKVKDEVLLFSGGILSTIGFLLLASSVSVLSIYIAITPFMIGQSLLQPAVGSLISKNVDKQYQGSVFGISQAIGASMRILAPITAGLLFGLSISLPFYFGAVLFLVVFLISIQMSYDHKNIVIATEASKAAV